MAARRYVSITDIVVAIVALVAIFLPARPLEGVSAARGNDDERFALAAAEARVRAVPGDGASAEELSRRLIGAGEGDFAVEAPLAAAAAMQNAPLRWRAQIATARAYTELRDVKEAYEWAQRALNGCHDVGAPACPSFEEVRLDIYAGYLEAGIERGIDPKVDPEGFRKAAETGLHMVHLTQNPQSNPPAPPPTPAPAPAPAPAP
jgi:hypothetical protein